jgi:hypothetical protein
MTPAQSRAAGGLILMSEAKLAHAATQKVRWKRSVEHEAASGDIHAAI